MPDPGRSPAAQKASVVVLMSASELPCLENTHIHICMHLVPFLESHMTNNTTRIDADGGTYQDTSLNPRHRAKRGETEGRPTKFSEKAPIPKGAEWQKYLKDSDNKDELFQLLSEQLVQNTVHANYRLLTTKADLVLSNSPTDVAALLRHVLTLRHALSP